MDAQETNDNDPIIDPRKEPKPVCNNETRTCALYGLRFIICVCDAIPAASLNLETVKQDCYFATDDLDKMTNSHKCNMIY